MRPSGPTRRASCDSGHLIAVLGQAQIISLLAAVDFALVEPCDDAPVTPLGSLVPGDFGTADLHHRDLWLRRWGLLTSILVTLPRQLRWKIWKGE